jgi:hypothetical protein
MDAVCIASKKGRHFADQSDLTATHYQRRLVRSGLIIATTPAIRSDCRRSRANVAFDGNSFLFTTTLIGKFQICQSKTFPDTFTAVLAPASSENGRSSTRPAWCSPRPSRAIDLIFIAMDAVCGGNSYKQLRQTPAPKQSLTQFTWNNIEFYSFTRSAESRICSMY